MVLCGMVLYGMVWYGMVWYGMAWHGMVRCGMWCIRISAILTFEIYFKFERFRKSKSQVFGDHLAMSVHRAVHTQEATASGGGWQGWQGARFRPLRIPTARRRRLCMKSMKKRGIAHADAPDANISSCTP